MRKALWVVQMLGILACILTIGPILGPVLFPGFLVWAWIQHWKKVRRSQSRGSRKVIPGI